ncbi:YdeI/OmpD-associated family protein [Algoriphagus jejuensis]
MNPKVDFYFEKAEQWQDEYRTLRAICLETSLTEELKWGCPCYTFHGTNVVLIHGFKDYCALLFHKGVLLKDPEGILIQQTENVQSARQIRFTDVKQIQDLKAELKGYIFEAIEVEKAGLKVPMKKTADFEIVEEFETRLAADPELKAAFEGLTPGRQKGYLLHFGQAKQSKTRETRIEKSISKIFDGKGWNE